MPTLVCRTSAASKTKCGYDEYAGYESTPPKKYLTRTLSGSQTLTDYNGADCTGDCLSIYRLDYSGACTYSRPGCGSPTENGQVRQRYWQPCDTLSYDITASPICSLTDGIIGTFPNGTETFSSTTRTITGDGCTELLGNLFVSGAVVETLSSEYATSTLSSDVTSALPSYGSYSSGDCSGAYYNVSDDELTITKRKMQYKFTLPSLGGYACYKLTWNEHFVAEGGTVTNTAKTYQWDGSATETGEYTIDVPASEGTTTITDLVASNACS
jgi:hypothetical protein